MQASEFPMPASEALKEKVREQMAQKGRLYARIDHPDFVDWPWRHDPKTRQDLIEPHLNKPGGAALDIGANYGSFSHWLERLGYTVTAIERNEQVRQILTEVRDLYGRKFEVLKINYVDLKQTKYDLVLALNVLHHALKRQDTAEALDGFLPRLEAPLMIFQNFWEKERPMLDAYRPLTPDQFLEYISEKMRLRTIEEIGIENHRKIYKLTP